MSLLITLSSSSFFLPQYLESKIRTNTITRQQLEYAVNIGVIDALIEQQQRQEYGSLLWIKLTKELANDNPIYAFELGEYFAKVNEDSKGAINLKSKFWYKQATKQGYLPAAIALARIYFKQEKYQQAFSLVSNTTTNIEGVILAIKIAISNSNINFVIDNYQQLINKRLVTPESLDLYNSLIKYQVIPRESKLLTDVTTQDNELKIGKGECQISVQFFATTLANLRQLDQTLAQFTAHPLAPYVCFSEIRYVAQSKLGCDHEDNKRISCNGYAWMQQGNITTRYVGVLVPKGGANVNKGILYIDKADTVAVFAHEISHFIGFIDEYPLPKNHNVCSSVQSEAFSHNIAILKPFYYGTRAKIRANILSQLPWAALIEADTPILQPIQRASGKTFSKQKWQVGTGDSISTEVGLFKAQSCQLRTLQAFKPIKRQSQLRYFEKEFPAEYKAILALNPNAYLMPSFHYNVALALINDGKSDQVQHWLDKAKTFEQSIVRKNKIQSFSY